MSFQLESGKTLAILGRTGCGKTTLLQLITRMYDVSSGVVRVGGVDVRELDLKLLRDHIGAIPQEAFLFSDTLENNIRFGKGETTKTEVENAAKQAAVHNSIMNFLRAIKPLLVNVAYPYLGVKNNECQLLEL